MILNKMEWDPLYTYFHDVCLFCSTVTLFHGQAVIHQILNQGHMF